MPSSLKVVNTGVKINIRNPEYIYIYIKKQRIVDLVSILMIGNWNWNITIATIVIIWLLKVTNKLYESHWEMKVTGNGNIYI